MSMAWAITLHSLDRLVRSESFKTANLDTNLIQREEAFLLQHNETVSSELIVTAALIELCPVLPAIKQLQILCGKPNLYGV